MSKKINTTSIGLFIVTGVALGVTGLLLFSSSKLFSRTRDLIGTAISAEYAEDVTASRSTVAGVPVVAVTVRATLPVIGLLGFERGLEVTGHAAVEHLE